MPQNLPEQILQRIVRLLADANSQQEVARMLGVSQGCISKILRRNGETGRPHQRKRGGSMKISTPREDRQLLRMVKTNRFISVPRLRMQMIRRYGRRMSVRTIRRRLLADWYWSRRPARCPRLTLGHWQRRREWERRHRMWDLRQWRHCIFSDESPSSPYTTVTVGSGCAVGKEEADWCLIDASLMMKIAARQSWYVMQSTMGGGGGVRGVSWSWWMEPWACIGTSRSWGIKCSHGRRGLWT